MQATQQRPGHELLNILFGNLGGHMLYNIALVRQAVAIFFLF